MPGFTSVVTNFVKRFPGASRIFQNMVYITATGIIGFGAMLGVNYPAVPGSGESSIVVGLLTKETGTGGISGTGAKVQTIAGVTDDGTIFTKSGGILFGPLNNPYFRVSGHGTAFFKNLVSCSALQTSSSGALQCVSAGLSQAAGDSRYVNTSGDTMTGGLLIQNGGTAGVIDAGLLLEILGTASGRTLHAQDTLRSSGSLLVERNFVYDDVVMSTGSTAVQSLYIKKSNAVSATATETDFDLQYTIPPNTIRSGDVFSFVMNGSGVSAISESLTTRSYFGSKLIGATDNSLEPTPAAIIGNGLVIFTSAGVSGQMKYFGTCINLLDCDFGARNGISTYSGATVDTTQPITIKFTGDWATAGAGNRATMHTLVVQKQTSLHFSE